MSKKEETTPVPEILNDGYDLPHPVSDIQIAFPASLGELLPPWEIIPEDFKDLNDRTDWNRFVTKLFFFGWAKAAESFTVYLHPDIDGDFAMRHLRVLLGSYEPKHEHKMAAVSWLMSRWFLAIRPVEA